mgnify:CR=1 FL=1
MLDATPVILYTAGMIIYSLVMVWLFRYLKGKKRKGGD